MARQMTSDPARYDLFEWRQAEDDEALAPPRLHLVSGEPKSFLERPYDALRRLEEDAENG